jgi:soluble lytic murein transglycosylase-like protein
MATLIDSLVMQIKFDITDLQKSTEQIEKQLKALEDKTKRTGDALSAHGKAAASFFNLLRDAAAALGVTLTTGALANFIRNTASATAEQNRLALAAGISIERYRGMAEALEELGVSASTAQSSLSGVAEEVTRMQTQPGAQSNLKRLLNFLGLSPFGADGTPKGPDQILVEIARAFQQKNLTPALQASYMQLGGLSPDLLYAMRNPDLLEAKFRAARGRGASQAEADEYQKLTTAITTLRHEFDAISNVLLVKFVPGLTRWVEWLTDIVDLTGGKLTLEQVKARQQARELAAAPPGHREGVAAAQADQQMSLIRPPKWLPWYRTAEANLNMNVEGFNRGDIRRRLQELILHGISPDAATRLVQAELDAGGLKFGTFPAGAATTGQQGRQPLVPFSQTEQTHHLPAGLLASVYEQETGSGRDISTSSAGAEGWFQIMPETQRRFGVTDPMNLDDATEGAAKYLEWLLAHYNGDIEKAVAGYNAGEGNVDNAIAEAAKYGGDWRTRLKPETQRYMREVPGRLPGGGAPRPAAGNQTSWRGLPAVPSAGVGMMAQAAGGGAVTINGGIHVRTASADPEAVVVAINRAVAERRLIARANTGIA